MSSQESKALIAHVNKNTGSNYLSRADVLANKTSILENYAFLKTTIDLLADENKHENDVKRQNRSNGEDPGLRFRKKHNVAAMARSVGA